MYEAARAKAHRGELRIAVPFGYIWHRDYGLGFDPDMRLQEVIRLIFARFRELGSARQVLISLINDGVHFPRPSDGKKMASFDWVPIRYRNVISILKNPFYAGAYVYGKSEKRSEIVDGRVRKSYGHHKPASQWAVVLNDHHEGYIEWSEYKRNQELLVANAYGKAGGVKSGRGGRALLPGLITCGRCGRRLAVTYAGRGKGYPVYRCLRADPILAKNQCMSFNGFRTDAAVIREALDAVGPMAIEAALEAERMQLETEAKRRHLIELDLQQARYEASLAERRYAACDPENRLIAAQLEKSWETTLRRVETCEARLSEVSRKMPVDAIPDFTGLAQDLEAAWNTPGVDMRCRQQLLRALIKDIVADVDDDAREVVLTIHWHGGQHSQVRVRKPKSGEHCQRTPEEALAIMRSMATRWSDTEIAATLNRMGMQTGQAKTWTARCVQSLRTLHKISGYRSSNKNGEWLTMSDAAARLGVSPTKIRCFIKNGILAAEQIVRGAPYQIRASDLEDERIKADLARRIPRRTNDDNQKSLFSTI
jgi:hypothetical protein